MYCLVCKYLVLWNNIKLRIKFTDSVTKHKREEDILLRASSFEKHEMMRIELIYEELFFFFSRFCAILLLSWMKRKWLPLSFRSLEHQNLNDLINDYFQLLETSNYAFIKNRLVFYFSTTGLAAVRRRGARFRVVVG